MSKVLIIGAGIGGIATAIRLRSAGHEVHVFEAAGTPGGKLSEKWIGDFRFDLGPSLFTLPENVNDLYRCAGENPAHHFSYKKLDTLCCYFWNDGQHFESSGDRERFIRSFSETFGESPERVAALLEKASFTYDRTAPVFLRSSLHRLHWFNAAMRKAISAIPFLPLRGSMKEYVARYLQHPRSVQYFCRYATYNGSNPYQAPAMLSMIPHLEHGIGAYLPEQGMYSITKSLHALALRMGVQFHFDRAVQQIIHSDGSVRGIKANNEIVQGDLVVSNADIHPTYRKLLPDMKEPERLLAQEKSSSAFIFYWGIGKCFPQLDLHNIFFADNYEAEFNAIFKDRILYTDPTIYINITSKYVEQDAPAGKENWFVMVNVPNHSGQDWNTLGKQLRACVIKKLSAILGTDIGELIEVEDVLTPELIESRTSSFKGSLYGNASNNAYAAFLRHANHSSQLKGLYFCGGSVHPGGGIPLCLFGAEITASVIAEDLK